MAPIKYVMSAIMMFAMLLPGLPAGAQAVSSKSALAVSPAILENVLTPGAATSFTVQVHNVTNFPLPIKTFMRGLTVEAHTTDISETEQQRLDASKWFVIKDSDFILQPNQIRTVSGTIETPADAEPGGHYATIFFQPLVPAEALSPSTAYINARVGVLSFLIVKGDIKPKAEIESGIQTSGLVQQGPVTFSFRIRNSGNVHLLPTGKLAIYDVFGAQVANLDVPPGTILPDSVREYTIEWNAASFINRYHAELTLDYGDEGLKLPKTLTTVWVLPWAALLLCVAGLAVVVFIITKTRRRWRLAWEVIRGNKRQ